MAAAATARALAPAQDASDDVPEIVTSMWGLIELVEAAAGRRDGAGRSATDRLAERNDASANDWSRGLEARARALLAHGDAAESLYREAIERLGRTRLRPELARAHLLFGEWLRLQNRRVQARQQLRTALDLLSGIGMSHFAERARHELLVTGERLPESTPETRDDLTAQERQIAMLARAGPSNPEIGGRLFLSPRAVEWHLRKVFTKLGIGSRRELVRALPDPDPDLEPASA